MHVCMHAPPLHGKSIHITYAECKFVFRYDFQESLQCKPRNIQPYVWYVGEKLQERERVREGITLYGAWQFVINGKILLREEEIVGNKLKTHLHGIRSSGMTLEYRMEGHICLRI
jgi:hypothetical protein